MTDIPPRDPDDYSYDISSAIRKIKAMRQSRRDGLKQLRLVSPQLNPEFNDQVGVAKCQTREQVALATNRSGKSLSCAAKIAAAARNVPLFGWDGEEINCRPSHQKNSDMTIWIVGDRFSHIGDTIFRLLFAEGQFQVIRDPDTNAMRAFQPWNKWDSENWDKVRPGAALIPSSEIDHDSWAWEQKATKQFIACRLKNGTQFRCYPATAEPKRGDAVHACWLDDITHASGYTEWFARLMDYEGWILWSTMQYPSVPQIGRLIERAEYQEEQVRTGERTPESVITSVYRFRTTGNPYIKKESVDVTREVFESEGDDEAAMRIDGGNPIDRTLIYPFFSRMTHCAIPEHSADHDDLATVLKLLGGRPPADWTHTMTIDPGAQKPGVLFSAVPPRLWKYNGKEYYLWADEKNPFYVPYAEIYGKRCNVTELLKQMRSIMTRDGRLIRFRRFIMDMHGGKISSMTGGAPPHRVFSDALAEEGIESDETGFNFRRGSDDFSGRRQIVNRLLEVRACGQPQLRIVVQNCPNLVWQLERNQFALQGEVVTDKEARRERNDLRQCMEYDCSCSPKGPRYVEIEQERHPRPRWVDDMEAWEERMGRKSASTRCHMGPGRAP